MICSQITRFPATAAGIVLKATNLTTGAGMRVTDRDVISTKISIPGSSPLSGRGLHDCIDTEEMINGEPVAPPIASATGVDSQWTARLIDVRPDEEIAA